jgi:chorismate-pyruvate lyase
MVRMATSTSLEAALSRASGTVTDFLEQLVCEPIDAGGRRHETTMADASNALKVPEGQPLLMRSAVLQGRSSGCSFVYAESLLVPGRLPERFRRRLQSGSDPIGRILREEGIPVTREPVVPSGQSFVSVLSGTDTAVGDCLLARTYRVDTEGVPVMIITEWFLSSLERFLVSR